MKACCDQCRGGCPNPNLCETQEREPMRRRDAWILLAIMAASGYLVVTTLLYAIKWWTL